MILQLIEKNVFNNDLHRTYNLHDGVYNANVLQKALHVLSNRIIRYFSQWYSQKQFLFFIHNCRNNWTKVARFYRVCTLYAFWLWRAFWVLTGYWYLAFVIVSLTWLAYFQSRGYLSYINSLGFLFIFCFSLTKCQCSKRETIQYYRYWKYTDLFYISIYIFHYRALFLNPRKNSL